MCVFQAITINLPQSPTSFNCLNTRMGSNGASILYYMRTTTNAFIHFDMSSQGQPSPAEHYSFKEFAMKQSRERVLNCFPFLLASLAKPAERFGNMHKSKNIKKKPSAQHHLASNASGKASGMEMLC